MQDVHTKHGLRTRDTRGGGVCTPINKNFRSYIYIESLALFRIYLDVQVYIYRLTINPGVQCTRYIIAMRYRYLHGYTVDRYLRRINRRSWREHVLPLSTWSKSTSCFLAVGLITPDSLLFSSRLLFSRRDAVTVSTVSTVFSLFMWRNRIKTVAASWVPRWDYSFSNGLYTRHPQRIDIRSGDGLSNHVSPTSFIGSSLYPIVCTHSPATFCDASIPIIIYLHFALSGRRVYPLRIAVSGIVVHC